MLNDAYVQFLNSNYDLKFAFSSADSLGKFHYVIKVIQI